MTNTNFIPIIIGTDMNAYNMAISFHVEYGINPILVGKEPLSFTSLSSIIKTIELNPKLPEKQVFVSFLKKVAAKYAEPGKKNATHRNE